MDNLIRKKRDKLIALQTVYSNAINELTEFRAIMSKILFWASGAFLLMMGWVIEATRLTFAQKIVLSIGIGAFLLVICIVIARLKKYFLHIAAVVNRCDQVHLTFEIGAFLPGETLFPSEWSNFGTPEWREPIFEIAYPVLMILSLICLAIIWLV